VQRRALLRVRRGGGRDDGVLNQRQRCQPRRAQLLGRGGEAEGLQVEVGGECARRQFLRQRPGGHRLAAVEAVQHAASLSQGVLWQVGGKEGVQAGVPGQRAVSHPAADRQGAA